MKQTLLTLAEAAAELGVSKETLRNWDRNGKLSPVRNQNNNYRMYREEDVRGMKVDLLNSGEDQPPQDDRAQPREAEFRRLLAKIHRVIRDVDGKSNLLERLDEAVKVLFMKIQVENHTDLPNPFDRTIMSSPSKVGKRFRECYSTLTSNVGEEFPQSHRSLKLSDDALMQLAQLLSGQKLTSLGVDIKGVAFEEMISNTFDKSDNQQFFTPKIVAEFMVKALGKRIGKTVLDPACGTGGFLIEALKVSPKSKLSGWEIDDRLAWIASMNLMVHESESYEVDCLANGGSLGRKALDHRQRFDTIITNPPFGSDFAGDDLSLFVLGKGRKSRRRGVLFLERCLDLLSDNGRMAIVLDDGVFSQSGNEDVRKLLLDRSTIEGIVSLPVNAFQPYATVNTSIIFCKKTSKNQDKQTIFYARAENVGRKPNGNEDIRYDENGTPFLNSDLPKILSEFDAFLTTGKTSFSYPEAFAVSIDTHGNEFVEGGYRLDYNFHHPARHDAANSLASSAYPLVSISEVVEEIKESVTPSVDLADQMVHFTGLSNIDSKSGSIYQEITPANSIKSACKRYMKGDILFSRMRPNLRKIGLSRHKEAGFASAECLVLRPRIDEENEPVMLPRLIEQLLRSDLVYGQVMHLITGIGRPRLNSSDFRKIKLPLPPRDIQKSVLEEFDEQTREADQLRTRARKLSEQAMKLEKLGLEALSESILGRG